MRVTLDLASAVADEAGDDEEQCALCAETIRTGQGVYRLPCGHSFHRRNDECVGVGRWLRGRPTCPLCRAPAWLLVPEDAEGGD